MKIAIIGHFGGKKEFLDGQTVKTKILYQELSQHTDWRIQQVDTYYSHVNPLKFVGQLMLTLLTTKDIIIITSQNGRRVLFPILYIAANVWGARVYHDVIGGRLGKFTVEYPAFVKYLNSFRCNWVETMSLKRELESVGVYNCDVVPNFKRLSMVREEELQYDRAEPYKLCTFSRVMREKGIEDAVNAVNAVNTYFGRTVYTLDIYGQIDPGQESWFEELRRTFPEWIRYKGQVPFDKSVETLKEYYALLFPTYYEGEGFAGTLLDAMASGVPVIASDWKYNPELVREGKTGVLFPAQNVKALAEKLCYACEHPEQWNAMRPMCLEEAEKYRPENVIRTIIDRMEA